MIPTRTHSRLLQYAAFSSSFLLLNETNAQSEYHEFDPYLPLTSGSTVFLDIDDDGTDDFSFQFAKSWGTSSTGYSGNNFYFQANQFEGNEVMIVSLPPVLFSSSAYSVECSFPGAYGVQQLGDNVMIDAFDEWGQADVMARVDHCGLYGADGEQGEWLLEGSTKDYFVGFRTAPPLNYYGWIRIRHNDFGDDDYIKDYYLSDLLGAGVQTPDVANSKAPAADDLNLYYDGDGKLMLTFSAASNEDNLEEYRVILRNTIFTTALTATQCETTLPGNYITVNKTGIDTYSVDISALTNDWVGNTLDAGDGISAYVYSKFNYPVTLLNGLSPESNEIEKSTDVITILGDANNLLHVWNYDDVLHIETNNVFIEKIMITDMLGRIIYSEPVNIQQSHITIPIQLQSGIYVISAITDEGILSKQIKL